jgi:C-terminal processing protease CtpA/Prc
MKRKILIISVGILTLSIMVFFACSKIFKAKSTQVTISDELTSAQKETDFRYLTNLTLKVWPFVETNAKIKGLSDISALSDEYIQKARKTKNDTEFMKLIEEYITGQYQTGHANLLYEDPIVTQLLAMSEGEKSNIKQTLSFYNINQSALNKINYWFWIDDKILKTKFMQPEVKIMYTNGKYIVTEPCKLNLSGKVLQRGTEIENIDGYPVDEYVKILQTKIRLGYDNNLHKPFLFNPLMVKSQNSDSGWKVSFRLPDNDIEDAVVSESYQSNTNTGYPNVITEDLSENIGYIKIFSFINKGAEANDNDKKSISDYIKKSQGKYKKLIIDIRGNGGGDPAYWQDLIVAPLIKKSVEYTQTAVVKKNFFKIWGKTVQQYLDTQYIDTQTPSFINKKNNVHLQEVDEVKNFPGYDDSWITFNIPHKISPEGMLPFDGKIYLLVDGGTFSASEDFAQFCKRTGFAEIVGNNTGGGAAAFLSPHYFCLPESKITFRLEVETVLNPDGTMSEELGTEPDIKMEIRPTPTNYNKESLMQDDWICRIIKY